MSIKTKIDPRTVQTIMATSGYYKGAIDGDLGPVFMKSVDVIDRNMGNKMRWWSEVRKVVGAVQRILDVQGYEPGKIDGYYGHNTANAITAFMSGLAGVPDEVDRDKPSPVLSPGRVWSSTEQRRYPTQDEVGLYYGPAGGPLATAGSCKLPIPFPLAWNTSQRVTKFACHERVADAFTAIFEDAVKHYGENEYRRLKLDMFGGCFNNRTMRGGKLKSMHAWGIAIDLDPERNQLRWGKDRAAFAKDDYIPFWNIVVGWGGTPAGYAWGADFMHFQMARFK